ncbi:asparagine synthase C-terminal domain-containing protein [Prevotella sp. E9-3]|uniref:asparagine synthase C-terminal domain-containing protein n=1 Tax=Prevotella sp. E9-3 TaxID=2913621 RepID=UPI001EDBF7A9|nr:asparagine synthase C-terminal domain-containing protein [Prevotella sp. E9-3]UKK48660.1 asparagine synthase C-terminal domain-containing protein [Prevotella sp. E9-3]
MDFCEGFQHKNYAPIPDEERIPVKTSEDIDREIQRQFDALYAKYDNIGILLSGGMDSANLAAYLKPGSHAYTFTSASGEFDADIERAKKYCAKWKLQHHFIEVTMDDFKQFTPIVMRYKYAPVHSIEAQIYKAAIQAKADGVQLMIVGESSDLIFGGMDKLISPEWTFDGFAKRYTFLDPKLVLTNPVDQSELYERYRTGETTIDFMRFMDEVFAVESSGSYLNAFGAAWMPYYDPYASLVMSEPLDMHRVRNGEPKYLVRGLYAMKYPELEIPFKIPMPRPVDAIFKDWEGPKRAEFRKDIPMEQLTGNQKWQLWCAEQFLNMLEK